LTPITIIIDLIRRFPLRNHGLDEEGLDTRYSRVENDWQAELMFGEDIWITFREIISKFNELLSIRPVDVIILLNQNRPGVNDRLDYFIDTMRNEFSDDPDVENFLTHPIIELVRSGRMD